MRKLKPDEIARMLERVEDEDRREPDPTWGMKLIAVLMTALMFVLALSWVGSMAAFQVPQ